MSTAITKFDPLASDGLAPALKLADALAKSDLVPTAYRGKPANVLLATIAGQELGLGVAQSLRAMHIIEGKPTLTADAMGALCLRHSDVCEYLTLAESTEERATYETHRRGTPSPVRLSWTFAQATAAGLAQKATWKAHRAAMLRARCLAAICRAVYPDLVLGVYDPDELEPNDQPTRVEARDVTAEAVVERPVRAEAAAEPVSPDVREITIAEGKVRRVLVNWEALIAADPDHALAFKPSGPHAGEPLSATASDAELRTLGEMAEAKTGTYWPALALGVRRELATRAGSSAAQTDDDSIPEFEREEDAE